MKYKIVTTSKFVKDLKLIKKRGYDINKVVEVVNLLASCDAMPEKYKDHPLAGNYEGKRECHISPDWLLIYEKDHNKLFLYLLRSGTHSDLF